MTELEALNTVLEGIGVYPVTSYDSPHPDAVRARQHLRRFSNELQSRGWWFNRDTGLTLTPGAVDKKILLPSNTLSVDAVDTRLNVIQRGNYLYDQDNNTFVFDNAIEVDLITELNFEDMPSTMQSYITRSAQVEFAIVNEGDQNKIKSLQATLHTVKSTVIADDMKNGDYNVFRNGLPLRLVSGMRPVRR